MRKPAKNDTLTLKLDEYQYAASKNPKFMLFVQLLEANPQASWIELAQQLEVTRQTIHQWLRRIRDNQPVRPRGRRRKYERVPTVGLTVRVPGDLATLLDREGNGQTTIHIRHWIDELVAGAYAELVGSHSGRAS